MSALPEFVADASVVAKWYLSDEDDVDHARRVLDDFVSGHIRLTAPEQIVAEIGSTLTVAASATRNRIQKNAARAGFYWFLALPIATVPIRDLGSEAYDLSEQHSCAFYDALYVTLAKRRAIPFINADRKLHDRIGHLPGVIWVADYVSLTDHATN
ncbi:MAG TPA: type II toxin-antitoxin system VapC family toxin [Thermomicrobiales bacterium]|jgi:predicted nucleic acid-binding protein